MAEMTTTSSWDGRKPQVEEPYPHARMWINGRHTLIDRIIHEREQPQTPFEDATFRFVKTWLTGEKEFTINTSGSTGPPKQIIITRSQMITSAFRTASRLNLRKNSTALVSLDPQYIAGKMMLVRSLVCGFRIMALDPTSNPLIQIPVDRTVQFSAFVPYQIESILESKHPHLLNNLDKVLIGGAPLSDATRAKLERFQCACYESFGMTETISHIALRLVNTPMKQPYFETLPGITIRQDDRGCLVINADYLPDTVVTNDIVELIDTDKFVWLGRWDNVINTGGIKVIPEKLEQQLTQIFQLNSFANRFFIAALPDDKLGNKIVLVLEGVQFSSEFLEHLLNEIRSVLSPYEVPREVYVTPAFATTDTDKVDRKQTMSTAALLPLSA